MNNQNAARSAMKETQRRQKDTGRTNIITSSGRTRIGTHDDDAGCCKNWRMRGASRDKAYFSPAACKAADTLSDILTEMKPVPALFLGCPVCGTDGIREEGYRGATCWKERKSCPCVFRGAGCRGLRNVIRTSETRANRRHGCRPRCTSRCSADIRRTYRPDLYEHPKKRLAKLAHHLQRSQGCGPDPCAQPCCGYMEGACSLPGRDCRCRYNENGRLPANCGHCTHPGRVLH